MTKKQTQHFIICAILLFLFAISCTQERSACLEPKISTLIMHSEHFASDTATIPVDTSLPKPLLIALVKTDSGISSIDSEISVIKISLSSASDTCYWMITPDANQVSTFGYDTLSFYYQRQLHFISNACGYTYYFNLLNVNTTRHNIDSVLIENRSVTSNVNTEHLRLYIKHNY